MQVNRESTNVFDDYILVPQEEKKEFTTSSNKQHKETIIYEVLKKEINENEEKVLNFPEKSVVSENVKNITQKLNTLRRRHIPDLHEVNQNLQKENAKLALENTYVKHKNQKLEKDLNVKKEKIESLLKEKNLINKENLILYDKVRTLKTETEVLKVHISERNQELDSVLERNNMDSQVIEERSQSNIESQKKIEDVANNLLKELNQETSIVVSERQALENKCQSLSRTNKILIVATVALGIIGAVAIGIGIAVLATGML